MDVGLESFLNLTPKATATKSKQAGLHQTKKLLLSKGDHQQNEKATYGMEEDICR